MLDPVAHIPDYWRHVVELTAKAIDIGIWHENDEGNLVKEPRPDPRLDAQVAAYRFQYEREHMPDVRPRQVFVKPTVQKILAPRADNAIAFNAGRPRSVQQPTNPDEDARLVAEFLARKKVTQLPAGYARNAK